MVVGTNAGGIPEIIRHGQTGFMVPPGNDKALALLLDTTALMTAEERAAIAGRALVDVRKRFSEASFVEGIQQYYNALLYGDTKPDLQTCNRDMGA